MTTIKTTTIAEVRQIMLTPVCDPVHVNRLLEAGWVLLSCATSPAANGFDAATMYALGRPQEVEA